MLISRHCINTGLPSTITVNICHPIFATFSTLFNDIFEPKIKKLLKGKDHFFRTIFIGLNKKWYFMTLHFFSVNHLIKSNVDKKLQKPKKMEWFDKKVIFFFADENYIMSFVRFLFNLIFCWLGKLNVKCKKRNGIEICAKLWI
jgi:hypothetical protein